jgi:hypothetical protein
MALGESKSLGTTREEANTGRLRYSEVDLRVVRLLSCSRKGRRAVNPQGSRVARQDASPSWGTETCDFDRSRLLTFVDGESSTRPRQGSRHSRLPRDGFSRRSSFPPDV